MRRKVSKQFSFNRFFTFYEKCRGQICRRSFSFINHFQSYIFKISIKVQSSTCVYIYIYFSKIIDDRDARQTRRSSHQRNTFPLARYTWTVHALTWTLSRAGRFPIFPPLPNLGRVRVGCIPVFSVHKIKWRYFLSFKLLILLFFRQIVNFTIFFAGK